MQEEEAAGERGEREPAPGRDQEGDPEEDGEDLQQPGPRLMGAHRRDGEGQKAEREQDGRLSPHSEIPQA